MVFPTHDPIVKSTAAVKNDVVCIDLCSDNDDDEKPKAKEDSSSNDIDATLTVDTYVYTSNVSSLLGKKRQRSLQTEACAGMGMGLASLSGAEDCVVVTEEELSNKCPKPSLQLSLPITASTQAASDGSFTSINIVPTPPPLIYIDGKDNLTITEGIPQLLSTHFPKTKRPGSEMVTCVGQLQLQTQNAAAAATTTLRHIEQKDKWSCGFRNLQMMLSALLPLLPPDHTYFQNSNGDGTAGARDQAGSFAIYSLRQIQQLFEELWKAGWDTTGARHFQYRIVGKQSQIGAVEVSSALSFRGVDNAVVQFIKCAASRRQLVPFCWAYFNRRAGCSTCRLGFAAATGTHNCSNSNMSSQAIAERLLASNNNVAADGAAGGVVSCSCSILPLYLQWEGHSVTIMGVERQMNGASSSDSSGSEVDKINLLVLDPIQDGTKLELALSRSNLAPARLPCKRLQTKDCQIVLCTSRPLSIYEMQERQQQVCAVTAAQDAVMKIAQRGM
jgi:hypothetical protein